MLILKILNKKTYFLNIFFGVCLIGFSIFSISKKYSKNTNNEKNLLYKISLEKINSNTENSSSELKSDANRWSNFFKNFSNKETYLNVDNDNNSFFIQQTNYDNITDLNKSWLNLTNFYQMSIDRYGYEFEDTGVKKDGTPKVHNIIEWKDFDIDNSYSINKANNEKFIRFNLKTDIKDQEIKLFTNKDKDKYVNENEKQEISNNWFLWLDKDILSLRLSYLFYTWIFNQDFVANETFITDILGGAEKTDEQKKLSEEIKKNYESFTLLEENFAKDYHSLVWSNNIGTNKSSLNQITNENLNEIYNVFKKNEKDLSIFKNNLLSVIENTEINTSNLFELEISPSPEDKKDNLPKFEKKIINLFFNKNELHETNEKFLNHLKNYSLRHFKLKTQDATSSTPLIHKQTYSSDKNNSSIIQSFIIPSQISQNINLKEILIVSIIFLSLCGIIITWIYKIPGIIAFLHVIISLFLTLSIIFILGFSISLLSLVAIFVIFTFSFIQMLHYLNIFNHLIKKIKLLKNTLFSTNKKSFLFLLESFLFFFIFASLISFSAPIYLRNFGIILSIGLLTIFSFNLIFFYKNFWDLIMCFSSLKQKTFNSLFYKKDVIIPNQKIENKINFFFLTIILIGAIGFIFYQLGHNINSEFIFKNNNLLFVNAVSNSYKDGKNGFTIQSFPSNLKNQILEITPQNSEQKFFLFSNPAHKSQFKTKIEEFFNPNSFSFQETFAFSKIDIFKDILNLMYYIFGIFTVFFIIKYGFINSLNLWISFIFLILFSFLFLIIFQIQIPNEFDLVFLFLIFQFIICSLFFVKYIKKINTIEFIDKKIDYKLYLKDLFLKVKTFIFIDFFVFSLLLITLFFIKNKEFYKMIIILTTLKFFIWIFFLTIKFFNWKTLQKIKHKSLCIFNNSNKKQTFSNYASQLEKYDEEIIENINIFKKFN